MLIFDPVHNDFHQKDGIFPLFKGLCVKDIDTPFGAEIELSNGHITNGVNGIADNIDGSVLTNGNKEG